MNRLFLLIMLVITISAVYLQLAFAQDPLLGHVATRNYLIVISSTSDGIRYAVRTTDGMEVASHLSADELATQYPSAYRKIHEAIAEDSPTRGAIIWAGL